MSEQAFALTPHPARPALPLTITGTVSRDCRRLRAYYRISGDDRLLRLPPPVVPGPADGLWRHTCLELFVAAAAGDAYREFNFAPSGQWASYAFIACRVRDAAADPVPPSVAWRYADGALALQVELATADLPTGDWRLGLSAVLEDRHGELSYWALHHPRPQPDFHDRGAFALTLTE